MAKSQQADPANYIQQLIDELGPRTAQRVLNILTGNSRFYVNVSIPPVHMLSGTLYRRARNQQGVEL